MSEFLLPPNKPAVELVPKLGKEHLFILRYQYEHAIEPHNALSHPLTLAGVQMNRQHRAISIWTKDLGMMINDSFGGNDDLNTKERFAFETSLPLAYSLLIKGYEETDRKIPGLERNIEWFNWLQEETEREVEERFKDLELHATTIYKDYGDLVYTVVDWASYRNIPQFDRGTALKCSRYAVAELFYAFAKMEELEESDM